MTHDLASRIADARKKAEAFESTKTVLAALSASAEFQEVASPSLFIEMADEIDRLRQALEPFAKAAAEYGPSGLNWDDHIWADDVEMVNVGHLRTAARVHADLTGEKEKEA